jgi:hypothetical protein
LLNLFLIGETALLGNCAVLVLIIEGRLGRGAPERGLSLLSSIVLEVLHSLLGIFKFEERLVRDFERLVTYGLFFDLVTFNDIK